ncbi:MAG: trigger factor [Acetobacter sp.]|nr:trigger factor [Acetobacter sp.]
MEVSESLSEGLKRGFTVKVSADELGSKRDARLKEVASGLNWSGFRPGKVPVSLVRQRYGSAVWDEVIKQEVSDSIRKIFEERGLRFAEEPQVDFISGQQDDGQGLEFTVKSEILPDITLPDFSTLELVRLKTPVGDEAVEKVLKDIAHRHRNFEAVEESDLTGKGAGKGDVLVVDFVGKIEGVPFEGGTAQDVPVEIEGKEFIPGFAEQIEGMSPNEEKTITVTFPEDYNVPTLAGKEATFDIKAKQLKKVVESAIDDNLAKKVGCENLDQLKESIRKQIEKDYEELSRLYLKRNLMDILAEKIDFDIPSSLVENEFKQIWSRIEADRQANRLDEEDKNKDSETLKADYQGIAKRRVGLGLLLAEVGRKNGISVTREELAYAMRAEAARYPGQERKVLEFFQKNHQAVDALRGPIFENKVVDYLVELAQVTEREVSSEELLEIVR